MRLVSAILSRAIICNPVTVRATFANDPGSVADDPVPVARCVARAPKIEALNRKVTTLRLDQQPANRQGAAGVFETDSGLIETFNCIRRCGIAASRIFVSQVVRQV